MFDPYIVVRIKKLCLTGYPKYAQWLFWPDGENEQTDLRWMHLSEGTFSDFVAYKVSKYLYCILVFRIIWMQ